MKNTPAHHNADPACTSPQYLEDLACAYWHSEVFFAALELDLFSYLATGCDDLQIFANEHGFQAQALERLLQALKDLALVHHEDGYWFNSGLARQYLVDSSPDCLKDILLYRRYMQEGWRQLTRQIAPHRDIAVLQKDAEYQQRNFHYVRAMDNLARLKAREIKKILADEQWQGTILDIGGGAGALSRALMAGRDDQQTVLVELDEVLQAARQLYPRQEDWQGYQLLATDFRQHDFAERKFGLILAANFFHAYDQQTARKLLVKATSLLSKNGLLVIHDYFPDRSPGSSSNKGRLYDLHMLANTYNGRCHSSEELVHWLTESGLQRAEIKDLSSDSSLIVAGWQKAEAAATDWQKLARQAGLRQALEIMPSEVVTAPWVQRKCQFGCEKYGMSQQCPPNSPNHQETRELLDCYRKALLVEGTPPGSTFHQKLLELEKLAFLAGNPKALIFGAGPCPVCDKCVTDGPCRFPAKARPAMEASGIDVYATARAAGIPLQPLAEKDQYVKYIGLLLIA